MNSHHKAPYLLVKTVFLRKRPCTRKNSIFRPLQTIERNECTTKMISGLVKTNMVRMLVLKSSFLVRAFDEASNVYKKKRKCALKNCPNRKSRTSLAKTPFWRRIFHLRSNRMKRNPCKYEYVNNVFQQCRTKSSG